MSAMPPLQVALLTVACFAGGAAGSFLCSAISPGPTSEPSGSVASPQVRAPDTDEQILRELRALGDELARMRDARSRVEPAADERTELSRETLLLQQIRALIEEARAPGGPSRPSEAEAVQRRVGNALASLRATVGTLPVDSGLLVKHLDAAQRTLSDGHLLWSLRDVLEHYGKPEQVAGGAGEIYLHYVQGDPPMQFRFRFVDGFVIDASIEGGY
jgi:hypothetical protein